MSPSCFYQGDSRATTTSMDTLLRRPSYGRCLVVADMVVLWLRVDAPVADTRSFSFWGDSLVAWVLVNGKSDRIGNSGAGAALEQVAGGSGS